MDNIRFRKAKVEDHETIWSIIQDAIERRRLDGSKQWQDGYPNSETISKDIEKGVGFVLINNYDEVVAYSAVLLNDEPAYDHIDGNWLSNDDYLVVHRVAVSNDVLGKGIAQLIFNKIENYALEQNIHSIKVDTNFDNIAMLRILEKLGYTYCGEVNIRGAARKAFEKRV